LRLLAYRLMLSSINVRFDATINFRDSRHGDKMVAARSTPMSQEQQCEDLKAITVGALDRTISLATMIRHVVSVTWGYPR
jgi:hypothetical protein